MAEVLFSSENRTTRKGTVSSRKRDTYGNPIGSWHSNPMLDSTVWEVKFSDGTLQDYTANEIAENIYADTDDDGWSISASILVRIVDHKADASALSESDSFFTTSKGNRHQKNYQRMVSLC